MKKRDDLKILVVGLGSMGKRRIRCLQSLGLSHVFGFDLRPDRMQEAKQQYQVDLVSSPAQMEKMPWDLFIISTPPDQHHSLLKMALKKGVSTFVEAGVIQNGLQELELQARKRGTLVAPSCTLRFHPAIRDIKTLVQSGKYGSLTNFSYHAGQYLPDWHPWEKVSDYYVSRKETGGGREIVPFELNWITDIFGFPQAVKAFFGKTMNVGADIDDTYSVVMRFPQGFGNLLVDVVARQGIRSLSLNLENAQITWNWQFPYIDVFEADLRRKIRYFCPESSSHEGYCPQIIEEMYIDEIRAFLGAAQGGPPFPHTLADEIKVLALLETIEKTGSPSAV
jgi:predicted dehydrogenase